MAIRYSFEDPPPSTLHFSSSLRPAHEDQTRLACCKHELLILFAPFVVKGNPSLKDGA